MEKLKKTARALDVFFKIVFWLVAAACAFVICMDVCLLLGGETIRDQIIQSDNFRWLIISEGGISIKGSSLPAVELMQKFWILQALFLAAGAFFLYGIKIVRNILRAMKAGSPFDGAVSKNLKLLGWLSLIFGAVQTGLETIAQNITADIMTEAFRDTDFVLSADRVYDGSFLLVAALLFLFSFVFKYGEELQQLSNETL